LWGGGRNLEKLDSNYIERIAVHAINSELIKFGKLMSNITYNDKNIGWDGNIELYSSTKINKKNHLKNINVQVKGRQVTNFHTNKKSYPIEIDYLRMYQVDGNGTLFFVVEVIDWNNTQIYYVNLLPYDIAKYLGKAGKQKTISIPLKKISENFNNIEDLCLEFHFHSMQQQKIEKILLDDSIKLESLDQLSLKFPNNNIDNLIGKDSYLYGTYKGQKIVIDASLKKIFYPLSKQVLVNGKVYYETYLIERVKNKSIIKIGNVVSLEIQDKKAKITLTGTLKGTLYERANDLDFIIHLVKNNGFHIDDYNLQFEIADALPKEQIIVNSLKILQAILEVIDMFESIGITFKHKLEDITQEEHNQIYEMIKAYRGEPNGDLKQKYGRFYLNIGNQYYLFRVINYKLCKYFTDFSEIEDKFSLLLKMNDDTYIRASHYLELEKEVLSRCVNFDKNLVVISIKELIDIVEEKYEDDLFYQLNIFLLHCISAYDISKNEDLLETAGNLIESLISKRPKEITYFLNKMQIMKRKDISLIDFYPKLMSLRETSNINEKVAISILLGNEADYKVYYEQLNEAEKEEFNNYPIANLATQL